MNDPTAASCGVCATHFQIIDDFSELGGGRRDVQGNSFDSVITAFGVKSLDGEAFKQETALIKIIDEELSLLYPGFPQQLLKTLNQREAILNVAYRDGQAVGVAIWKPKGNDIAKLSTFSLLPFVPSLGAFV